MFGSLLIIDLIWLVALATASTAIFRRLSPVERTLEGTVVGAALVPFTGIVMLVHSGLLGLFAFPPTFLILFPVPAVLCLGVYGAASVVDPANTQGLRRHWFKALGCTVLLGAASFIAVWFIHLLEVFHWTRP